MGTALHLVLALCGSHAVGDRPSSGVHLQAELSVSVHEAPAEQVMKSTTSLLFYTPERGKGIGRYGSTAITKGCCSWLPPSQPSIWLDHEPSRALWKAAIRGRGVVMAIT